MNSDELKTKYEHNPIVKSLIQLIPFNIGSAIDAGAAAIIGRVREKRAEIFFDNLSKTLTITEEIIETDDFVHKFLITSRAALNTQNVEKIKLFAKLLANSSAVTSTISIDVFDEFASIIEALNYREFILLSILESFERQFPAKAGLNEAQRVSQYWDKFMAQSTSELSCSENIVISLLNRCSRLGLFDLFQGRFMDPTPGEGNLTELYYELREYVADKTAYA